MATNWSNNVILVNRSHCAITWVTPQLMSLQLSAHYFIVGITFPSGEVQRSLLKQVYSEAGVDPAQVAYVEAHGTGTAAGDPQELNSITEVFCSGRQGPLLIGSTKSNMGHPEPASGEIATRYVHNVSLRCAAAVAEKHMLQPCHPTCTWWRHQMETFSA